MPLGGDGANASPGEANASFLAQCVAKHVSPTAALLHTIPRHIRVSESRLDIPAQFCTAVTLPDSHVRERFEQSRIATSVPSKMAAALVVLAGATPVFIEGTTDTFAAFHVYASKEAATAAAAGDPRAARGAGLVNAAPPACCKPHADQPPDYVCTNTFCLPEALDNLGKTFFGAVFGPPGSRPTHATMLFSLTGGPGCGNGKDGPLIELTLPLDRLVTLEGRLLGMEPMWVDYGGVQAWVWLRHCVGMWLDALGDPRVRFSFQTHCQVTPLPGRSDEAAAAELTARGCAVASVTSGWYQGAFHGASPAFFALGAPAAVGARQAPCRELTTLLGHVTRARRSYPRGDRARKNAILVVVTLLLEAFRGGRLATTTGLVKEGATPCDVIEKFLHTDTEHAKHLIRGHRYEFCDAMVPFAAAMAALRSSGASHMRKYVLAHGDPGQIAAGVAAVGALQAGLSAFYATPGIQQEPGDAGRVQCAEPDAQPQRKTNRVSGVDPELLLETATLVLVAIKGGRLSTATDLVAEDDTPVDVLCRVLNLEKGECDKMLRDGRALQRCSAWTAFAAARDALRPNGAASMQCVMLKVAPAGVTAGEAAVNALRAGLGVYYGTPGILSIRGTLELVQCAEAGAVPTRSTNRLCGIDRDAVLRVIAVAVPAFKSGRLSPVSGLVWLGCGMHGFIARLLNMEEKDVRSIFACRQEWTGRPAWLSVAAVCFPAGCTGHKNRSLYAASKDVAGDVAVRNLTPAFRAFCRAPDVLPCDGWATLVL